jgi:hypothetical protein
MINMNGFGFEPFMWIANAIHRIWLKSKSVHIDHEQMKNDVQMLNVDYITDTFDQLERLLSFHPNSSIQARPLILKMCA